MPISNLLKKIDSKKNLSKNINPSNLKDSLLNRIKKIQSLDLTKKLEDTFSYHDQSQINVAKEKVKKLSQFNSIHPWNNEIAKKLCSVYEKIIREEIDLVKDLALEGDNELKIDLEQNMETNLEQESENYLEQNPENEYETLISATNRLFKAQKEISVIELTDIEIDLLTKYSN
ncbi:MAG: hypothetical protein PHX27_04240 [Candidatus ainarchaeum sp.]|nr:hypothetical protein [Candidatus ainarchaeum sp.]